MTDDSPTLLLRTNAQLRAGLLARLQQPSCFLVIDITGAAPLVAEVCLRRADGRLRARQVSLSTSTAGPEAVLQEAMGAAPADPSHLVLLISADQGDRAAKMLLPWHAACASSRIECLTVAVDPAGAWRFHGSVAAAPPRTPHIIVHLGEVEHRCAAHNEPCKLRLRLGARPREYSRFKLQLIGSELTLPPLWFRLTGPELHLGTSVILTVDYDDDPVTGPRWLLEVLDSGTLEPLEDCGCEMIEEPPAVNDLSLAVVFDRTCADNASWPKAEKFMRGWDRSSIPDPTLASMQPAVDQSRPQEVPPEDFNLALRTSLGQALLDALAEFPPRIQGNVEMTPAWHADAGEDGFRPVERPVPPGGMTFGRAPSIPLGQEERIRQCFQLDTWVPGQDVFDPVEGVVDDLLQAFESKAPGTAALIIVGNSPPNLVNEAEERKAWKRFREFIHSDFSTRLRPGSTWAQALKAARNSGVPIIWAMLRHAPSPDAREGLNEVYSSLQGCVIEAMSTFASLGLGLTSSHVATQEGVTLALKEACSMLQKRLAAAALTTLRLETLYP